MDAGASEVEIRVVDEAWRAAGELIAEAAAAGGHIALSGGSTPGRAYSHAARIQPRWTYAELWWGDDRAVPPHDKASNYRLVRETLLDSLSSMPKKIHRVRGERPVEEAAALYDAELDGVTLDLALNGIGPDGHTASLFPNAPGLTETERRAIVAEAGLEPLVPRVTMTPPVFAAAALVVYLVTGEDKADAGRRAFVEPPAADTPASLVRGRTTIAILDAAAASKLP